MYKMLLIKKKGPTLNSQTKSIPAKPFTQLFHFYFVLYILIFCLTSSVSIYRLSHLIMVTCRCLNVVQVVLYQNLVIALKN